MLSMDFILRAFIRLWKLVAVSIFCLSVSTSFATASKIYTTTEVVAPYKSDSIDTNDPLESVNRVVFHFNDIIYSFVLRPLSKVYDKILPDFVQAGVHNALNNLNSPVILANDLLQGEFGRAKITIQRAVINTTVGVGGLYDAASKIWKIPMHKEDFGQTFAVWGVQEGFYLVLPIFGASNPRDATGLIVNMYADPFSHYLRNIGENDAAIARTAVAGLDKFSEVTDDLEKLKKTSVDYYAAVRSIYRQKRAVEIKNRSQRKGVSIPDLHYDLNAELLN